MINRYVGRENWGQFLRTVEEANERDGTISPGGAGRLLGVSRERIYAILRDYPDVTAWAFYDRPKDRNAEVFEISVRDLLRYAVRGGRMRSVEDLGWRFPRTERLLEEVLAECQKQLELRDVTEL